MTNDQERVEKELLADISQNQMTEGYGLAVDNYCRFMEEVRKQIGLDLNVPGCTAEELAEIAAAEKASELITEALSAVNISRHNNIIDSILYGKNFAEEVRRESNKATDKFVKKIANMLQNISNAGM